MQDWSRPDPLTRDLIHLINARRLDTVISGPRSRPFAGRLPTAMEHTVYLLFGVREEGVPPVPQELGPEEQEGRLQGLRAQCGDLPPARHLLDAPVYAAYALFDA